MAAKAKTTKPAKTNKDQKNGVTRPKEGSTTRKVWDIADAMKGVRADVLKECAKRKINPATATTQFGKWRQYHGIKGRVAKKAAAPKKVVKKVAKKSAPPAPPATAPAPAAPAGE